jgi:hypothetical protein
MTLVFRLLGGTLFAFALFNAFRMVMIDGRMHAYRSATARAAAFPIPLPMRWQVENYDSPAYPLIDEAWRAYDTMFLSGLAGVVLVILGGV